MMLRNRHIREFYISYIIIFINILVFIIMTAAGGTENIQNLVRFGAKVNYFIARGQYWRLITSSFIHIGLSHLVFNMYGLYSIGPLVEKVYGKTRFLLIYFISALSGSVCSFVFSNNISAGASGAIFGLLGALLYLGQKVPKLFKSSFGINMLLVIGFNLIYGFSNSGIDNFAHMGGLAGGFLCINMLGLRDEPHIKLRKLLSALLIIFLISIGIVFGTVIY